MFKKQNEQFVCLNCGKQVDFHPNSSRDHCTFCLYGQHVDINPGDRLNDCKGILKPIGLSIRNKKKQIVYKCDKCGKVVKCIVAPDDSLNEVIKLSSKVYEE